MSASTDCAIIAQSLIERFQMYYLERMSKVLHQRQAGLLTEFEMWQEIGKIADNALDDLETPNYAHVELGINEGIAR